MAEKEMKTEKALRESEEKFRLLADATTEGVVINEKGKIREANKSFASMFGYKPEEVIDMPVSKFVTPESFEVIKRNIQAGFEQPYEIIGVKKDGTSLNIEVIGKKYTFRGRAARMAAIRDITERKRAEEALKESEKKFKTLAEESPNMIFINKKGKVVYANKKCEEVMGYTRKEFYDENFDFMSLIAPESREFVKRNLIRHMRGEEILPYEYKLAAKDGKELIGLHTTKLIDYEGEKAVLGIITDITERKKAEEKLRYQASLLENIKDSITSVDMKGNIMSWNKGAERMHGWREEEVLGKFIGSVVMPPEFMEESKKIMKELVQKGSWKGEILNTRKDKTVFPVYASLSLVKDESNKPIGMVGITTDLSGIRKLEKEKKVLTEKVAELSRKISLTDNEKLIFYGLVKYPLLTDQQLSQKLGIKRSTVTAAKNKLKKQGFYSAYAIPNFGAIGCELMCILSGKAPIETFEARKKSGIIKKIADSPEVIFNIGTDKEFLSIIISKNFVETKELLDHISLVYEQNNNEMPIPAYFPFAMSSILNFFDYSLLLKSLFGLNIKEEDGQIKQVKRELTNNEKIILYALARYPDLADTEIAAKTKISRQTVSQIKNSLINDNFLKIANIPDVRKLDCELIAYSHGKIFNIKKLDIQQKISYLVFGVYTKREGSAIFIFEDYAKHKMQYDKLISLLKKEQLIIGEPTMHLFPISHIKFQKIDFAPLVKKIFGLKAAF